MVLVEFDRNGGLCLYFIDTQLSVDNTRRGSLGKEMCFA